MKSKSVISLIIFIIGTIVIGCTHVEKRSPEAISIEEIEGEGVVALDEEPTPTGVDISLEEKEQESKDYIIRIGDVLEISVWGEPDMTRQVPVRPDGKISYFLIGEIKAEGKTFGQLEAEIVQRLKKYIRKPKVVVIGKQFRGNLATIMGMVNKPGRFHVTNDTKLLDILAMAGGIKNIEGTQNIGYKNMQILPDLERSYIIRHGRVLNVNFYDLIKEKKMENNIVIRPGDFIYIPSSVENKVHVVGEVGNPVTITFGNRITLVEAITTAGGINRDASNGWVYIVRGSLRHPKVYRINMYSIYTGKAKNILLERGDIVYATTALMIRVNRVTKKIIPLLDVLIKSDTLRSSALNNY